MASEDMEEIAQLFSGLKFRRQLIGGVSEADIWKKLELVQNEYRRLYDRQAAGFEARIREREEQSHEI